MPVSGAFRLTMRKRIFGGFVMVLALLTVLAIVMWRGANTVIKVADEVSTGSAATEAATDIALRVADVHARTMQYTVSASVVDRQALEESLARLEQAIARDRDESATRA